MQGNVRSQSELRWTSSLCVFPAPYCTSASNLLYSHVVQFRHFAKPIYFLHASSPWGYSSFRNCN